jgi:DNA-binding transcriptional MerR regulator
MKTGKVAKVFGVDPKTIINWTDIEAFEKFFSPEARATAGKTQRDYSEADLMVLNTIRLERAQGTDWNDIAARLDSGHREEELPPQAMLVETTAPIAQYGRIITLSAERDVALAEVERLKDELGERSQTIDKLQDEIKQLNREIGRLEGRIGYMEERYKDKD